MYNIAIPDRCQQHLMTQSTETGCTAAHTGCIYMWLTSSTQSAARREHQHSPFWVVRCASEGKPYGSSGVISRFRAALQQQLKQDWARSQGDIRLDSGVPLSWLRGRSPVLSQQKFAARWQANGVLYTVVEGEGPRVCLPAW